MGSLIRYLSLETAVLGTYDWVTFCALVPLFLDFFQIDVWIYLYGVFMLLDLMSFAEAFGCYCSAHFEHG